MSYSQRSQRYTDESTARFVLPPGVPASPEWTAEWRAAVLHCRETSQRLCDLLGAASDQSTAARKRVRQAARAVLPNCVETAIVVTANARALRHFFRLRGSPEADVEIRLIANRLFDVVAQDAPLLFADFTRSELPDGTYALSTPYVT